MKNTSPYFLLTVMAIMFALMAGSQIGIEMLFDEDASLSLKNILMKAFGHVTAGLVILFFVFREVSKTKTLISKRLGFIKPIISKLDFLAFGFGSLAVAILAQKITIVIIDFFPFFVPREQTKLLQFIAQLTPGWGVLFVLVVALAPGFIEEIAYRGFLQRGLLKRFNPVVSIAVSSFAFGLAHIAPQEIIFTSIMGAWLGIIAWRVNSIWPTILCHAMINGTFSFYMLGRQLWQFPEDIPLGFKIFFSVALIYAIKILILKKNSSEYINLQNT